MSGYVLMFLWTYSGFSGVDNSILESKIEIK